MTAKHPLSRDYVEFITELKQRIVSARLHAARAVNRDLIKLYWDIGRGIVEKQEQLGWGKSIVESLAKDLQKAFPGMRGFSAANIWAMRRFSSEYGRPEFLQQLVEELAPDGSKPVPSQRLLTNANQPGASAIGFLQQLVEEVPWGHHLLLLEKVKPPKARLYYLRATSKLGWSRHVLLNQIKARAYERSLSEGKTHNFPTVLPEYLAEQAEEALKSSYNLEFLGIRREVKERELEDRLVERLRDFILELGYGFCFVGRQHRLTLSKKEFFIDLLFYHRFIKALVAVELKVGPFEPEYAGKMDFYLNLLNDKERAPDDNPSIGIILCAEKDDVVVEFSLKTKTNPIGVAEYHLTEKLPRELKGKLPTERQLLAAVKEAIEDKS
jgi:predicted nuclease of restriction endonuclease-like (RecB) superfamily